LPDDVLSSLGLTPSDVPSLPTKARRSLTAYLLRWGHFDAARRCLRQLLVTHYHQVSVYDELAKAHLSLDDAERALEIMERRHALRTSSTSQALVARIHLAQGDVEAAQRISQELLDDNPESVMAWGLRGDVALANGDWTGAEAAYRQMESLNPTSPAAAYRLARLYQQQNDTSEALRQAQEAVACYKDRDAPVDYLRLLETLLRGSGQTDEAEAVAQGLRQREQRELEELRLALSSACPEPRRRVEGPVLSPVEGLKPAEKPPARPPTRKDVTPKPPPAIAISAEERGRLERALRQHFGHASFRPGQAEIIANVLRGKNTLAVMPTGFGKSLCYQLASQLLPQTTLVISPLIALMKDQLDSLPPAIERQATTIHSALEWSELRRRLDGVADKRYRLVYAAPERLRQRSFLHTLKRAGVSLLVIDEAHCVSLWGHDFRPDYLFIGKALAELGHPPVLAMTATATPRVRDDITTQLGQMRLVLADVHRSNLRLEVVHLNNDEEKMQALLQFCREQRGSGIVYVNARQKSEQLAALLRRHGISAMHYHAGIEDRATAQERFMTGRARIVAATIAFGMGIDKPDIRFIVHYHLPRALENYYQEAGRAGRDGKLSRCVLFYAPSDKRNLTIWTRQDALDIELLRAVYGAIRRRLAEQEIGLVASDDLERDVVAEETKVRVAVSFLERAELLKRHFDLPRTAVLTVRQETAHDASFERFVSAARLRLHQPLSIDLTSVCTRADLDPREVESRLLQWCDRGWLEYRSAGRDMFLELLPPPPDASQRVANLLEEYGAEQDRRIEEMVAYATTSGCRHNHLGTYFGGQPVADCRSCDNCTAPTFTPKERPVKKAPPSIHPAGAILQCVSHLPFPLGKSGLSKALKGSIASSVGADRCPEHGALAYLSLNAIGQQIELLITKGYLNRDEGHEFRIIALTEKGKKALHDPSLLPNVLPASTVKGEKDKAKKGDAGDEAKVDEELWQRLRAWRLEQAQAQGVSAFVIFHDATLRRIAALRPADLNELAAIKGIGPSKLEKYGQEVLALLEESKPARACPTPNHLPSGERSRSAHGR
jgi:ATP-dependent DNA helicase RecQ